jgi:hypothetical protein
MLVSGAAWQLVGDGAIGAAWQLVGDGAIGAAWQLVGDGAIGEARGIAREPHPCVLGTAVLDLEGP